MSDIDITLTCEPVITIECNASDNPLQLVESGEKKTGVDEGYYRQFSMTDDYLYICVAEGAAGEAIWKKTLLFQT
ncbi:MAG: hypothetical protein NTV01_00120 [Bacteroidia bacterium]|nr:hypothetical protein [Bacteroidia bacterium]